MCCLELALACHCRCDSSNLNPEAVNFAKSCWDSWNVSLAKQMWWNGCTSLSFLHSMHDHITYIWQFWVVFGVLVFFLVPSLFSFFGLAFFCLFSLAQSFLQRLVFACSNYWAFYKADFSFPTWYLELHLPLQRWESPHFQRKDFLLPLFHPTVWYLL